MLYSLVVSKKKKRERGRYMNKEGEKQEYIQEKWKKWMKESESLWIIPLFLRESETNSFVMNERERECGAREMELSSEYL